MSKQAEPNDMGQNTGRPSIFSEEMAASICKRLADGETLRAVCRDEGFPSESTVRGWVLEDREGFGAQYMQARDLGLDSIADELFEIADDGRNDWMQRLDEDGKSLGWQLNGEHVQRSRVRLDIRKWYLSKLAPKKYGEIAELQRAQGTTINITILQKSLTTILAASPEDFAAFFAQLLNKATDAQLQAANLAAQQGEGLLLAPPPGEN